jgi:small-conductance mechanosensitive channel
MDNGTIIGEIQQLAGVEESQAAGYDFWVRFAIACGIVLLQIILIFVFRAIFHVLERKVEALCKNKLRAIKFKKLTLVDGAHLESFFLVVLKIVRVLVYLIQLLITVPAVLGLFEPTREVALLLLGYIITPLKNIGLGFLHYIPNIFTIAIIIIVGRYVLRALRFFARQVARRKVTIPGFYPEWAEPTFNILRVIVYAFMIAMIYPYLPNSDSKIFQGISVLLGLLFSFGSSSVIGNVIAGLVMTYMRPFRLGDRISIEGFTGYVVERGLMSTRLRTSKNEFISLPNQKFLSTTVTNYTVAASDFSVQPKGADVRIRKTPGKDATESGEPKRGPGLIIHAEITFGYDTPWTVVEETLLEAASNVSEIEKDPPPFVQQTSLGDFYCHYEINGYTLDIEHLTSVYSSLYTEIQKAFARRHISMFAPGKLEVQVENKQTENKQQENL